MLTREIDMKKGWKAGLFLLALGALLVAVIAVSVVTRSGHEPGYGGEGHCRDIFPC
jgi:hypothetical protein